MGQEASRASKLPLSSFPMAGCFAARRSCPQPQPDSAQQSAPVRRQEQVEMPRPPSRQCGGITRQVAKLFRTLQLGSTHLTLLPPGRD